MPGDWRDFAQDKARRWMKGVRAGKPVVEPFVYQGLSESPADLLACAEIMRRANFRRCRVARTAAARAGRIRIGYVCGEFRAQATMYLAAGLFEQS